MSQHENHYQCKVDNVIQYETKINLKLQSNNFHMYSAQVEPSKFNNHLKKKPKKESQSTVSLRGQQRKFKLLVITLRPTPNIRLKLRQNNTTQNICCLILEHVSNSFDRQCFQIQTWLVSK